MQKVYVWFPKSHSKIHWAITVSGVSERALGIISGLRVFHLAEITLSKSGKITFGQ